MPDPKVPHANPVAGAAPRDDTKPGGDVSRFVWGPGDIVIIKRGDESTPPQKAAALAALQKDLNS